jgi:RHS repeat-associated protein
LRYTGQQWDDSARMYYLRARYYSPANGLFNRIDPYSGNYSDPQSLHKYLYCHANPVNATDPSGRSAFGIAIGVAIGIAVIGAIMTVAGLATDNETLYSWGGTLLALGIGLTVGLLMMSAGGLIAIVGAITIVATFLALIMHATYYQPASDIGTKKVKASGIISQFQRFLGSYSGKDILRNRPIPQKGIIIFRKSSLGDATRKFSIPDFDIENPLPRLYKGDTLLYYEYLEKGDNNFMIMKQECNRKGQINPKPVFKGECYINLPTYLTVVDPDMKFGWTEVE